MSKIVCRSIFFKSSNFNFGFTWQAQRMFCAQNLHKNNHFATFIFSFDIDTTSIRGRKTTVIDIDPSISIRHRYEVEELPLSISIFEIVSISFIDSSTIRKDAFKCGLRLIKTTCYEIIAFPK